MEQQQHMFRVGDDDFRENEANGGVLNENEAFSTQTGSTNLDGHSLIHLAASLNQNFIV